MPSTLDRFKDRFGIPTIHSAHWLVIFLSLALTFSAWYVTKNQVEAKTKQRFEHETIRTIELVKERMHKYEDALWSGVAAIHSQSHGIDYKEWKKFADTLRIDERYPGINGIGVIYNVAPDKLPSFLATERKLRPDFHIHPVHEKEEYWPITYIEPLDINSKALGLDMAHEVNRLTAAKKARDSGNAQITAPITLVQDSQKTPGFLFYAPFYEGGTYDATEERQQHFVGNVYAPFIMQKLMEDTLRNEQRLVNISIKDGETSLYDEHQIGHEDYDPNPLFAKDIEVSMYGRPWVFHVQSTTSFRALTHNSQPLVILIAGIIIDIMLLILFITLSREKTQSDSALHESISFLELIMDNNPDFIFVKDEEFKIVRANSPFLSLYPAKQRDEIIGYTTLEKYEPAEAEAFLAEDRRAFKDGYTETIETITFPDGRIRTLYTNKIRFENAHGTPFILGIARDITELKRAEEKQLKLLDQLTQSNTELERFAYVASHDMQEPLRMITNFSQILAEDYAHTIDDEGKQYLKLLIDSGTRMRDMINDLLEYARLGHETNHTSAVDTMVELSHVLENLHPLIEQHRAEVTWGNLPNIHGNPVQFMSLLQNLITNAIKYQPEGNIPVIHVSAEELDTHWRFCVKDNGLGIEPNHIATVFEPFKRLHSWERYSGTGLGLALCRRIVENHSGEIYVTSTLGEGSEFYFTIAKHIGKNT